MRRACCACHVPLDGKGAITTAEVSHGFCSTCGSELYGDLWHYDGPGRWTGAQFAKARQLARHGTRLTARLLGISHSTVLRAEGRDVLTRYVQRALCARTDVHAYYRGLAGAA
jgi:hypothetical protein